MRLKSSWRQTNTFLLPSAWAALWTPLLPGTAEGWGEWDLDFGRCHSSVGVGSKSILAPDPTSCWEKQQHGGCEGDTVTLPSPFVFLSL